MYSVRPSASPKAQLEALPGKSMVPQCLPSGAKTSIGTAVIRSNEEVAGLVDRHTVRTGDLDEHPSFRKGAVLGDLEDPHHASEVVGDVEQALVRRERHAVRAAAGLTSILSGEAAVGSDPEYPTEVELGLCGGIAEGRSVKQMVPSERTVTSLGWFKRAPSKCSAIGTTEPSLSVRVTRRLPASAAISRPCGSTARPLA